MRRWLNARAAERSNPRVAIRLSGVAAARLCTWAAIPALRTDGSPRPGTKALCSHPQAGADALFLGPPAAVNPEPLLGMGAHLCGQAVIQRLGHGFGVAWRHGGL